MVLINSYLHVLWYLCDITWWSLPQKLVCISVFHLFQQNMFAFMFTWFLWLLMVKRLFVTNSFNSISDWQWFLVYGLFIRYLVHSCRIRVRAGNLLDCWNHGILCAIKTRFFGGSHGEKTCCKKSPPTQSAYKIAPGPIVINVVTIPHKWPQINGYWDVHGSE